jgi:ABC-type amino acid transport substrate-binding protein
VIIVSSLTASIAAALTTGELRGAVQSVEDLPRVRVGAIEGSTGEAFLIQRGIRHTRYADPAGAVEALGRGGLDAVVYDAPLLRYLVARQGLSGVRLLPGTFSDESYAIALRSASPLREDVNLSILRATGSQRWQSLLSRYLD